MTSVPHHFSHCFPRTDDDWHPLQTLSAPNLCQDLLFSLHVRIPEPPHTHTHGCSQVETVSIAPEPKGKSGCLLRPVGLPKRNPPALRGVHNTVTEVVLSLSLPSWCICVCTCVYSRENTSCKVSYIYSLRQNTCLSTQPVYWPKYNYFSHIVTVM